MLIKEQYKKVKIINQNIIRRVIEKYRFKNGKNYRRNKKDEKCCNVLYRTQEQE